MLLRLRPPAPLSLVISLFAMPEPPTVLAAEASRRAPWSQVTRLVAIGMAIGLIALIARQAGSRIPAFVDLVAGYGYTGYLLFVLGYAVAVVLGIPASLLTLAGGAVFGLGVGIALVFCGAMIGSVIAFLLSRYAVRRRVETRLAQHARFAAVDRAIAAQGAKVVVLLRLSPLFPFSLLNYALGLTRISLRDYTFAGLGMLPGTALYVYYGKLAGDVALLASGASQPKTPGYYLVLAGGLLATVVVTALITRTARRALRDADAEQGTL